MRVLVIVLTLVIVSAKDVCGEPKEQWRMIHGYTLHDLTVGGGGKLTGTLPSTTHAGRIVGTAGMSWPDGRQAIATTVEVTMTSGREAKAWVFRCIDHFDASLQFTGQACYELVRPQ